MECFTEFDELQEALKKVHMDEEVMPYYRGRLVENQDSYNKIQKLLNAPEMQTSHRYLYDLDVENLTEEEIEKVDELYDLGVKRGFIDNSFEDDETDADEDPSVDEPEEPAPAEEKPEPAPVQNVQRVRIPCWTVLYSATKDGETKCGECYSNAAFRSAAKSDCVAKLSKFGYENISILAIEEGDSDSCGDSDCANEYNGVDEDDMLRDRPHNAHVPVDEGENHGVRENDILRNRPHNGHKSVNEGRFGRRFDPESGMTYRMYNVRCLFSIDAFM